MSDREPVVVRYERRADMLRLEVKNITNTELGEVILGLWARLSTADRERFFDMVGHYLLNPDAKLSPIASGIARPETGRDYIDIGKVVRMEHGDLPA